MDPKAKFKSVDEYIASFPKEIQLKLKDLRAVVKESAPSAEESISYNMPYYSLNGRLLYFAAHEKHIGLYAMPSAIKKFKKELVKYETSTGTIQFPLNKPLPIELIKRIVAFREEENLEKK
jgi:uncharacterized protein YdhG (YjbR/CyaY superfamily)